MAQWQKKPAPCSATTTQGHEPFLPLSHRVLQAANLGLVVHEKVPRDQPTVSLRRDFWEGPGPELAVEDRGLCRQT